MRIQEFIAVLITLVLAACSTKSSDPTDVETTGQPIKAGFYGADNPDARNVPLVSIKIEDGKTYAYALLKYECAGSKIAFFDQSSIAVSEESTMATGPGVGNPGMDCNIQSDIVANADSSLQVIVTVNGVKQPPYTLSSTSKDNFVRSLRQLAQQVDHFTVPLDVCLRNFGVACDQVRLAAK